MFAVDSNSHVYEMDERSNYEEAIALSKQHKIPCYSKKQMKALYPYGSYKVIAAFIKGKKSGLGVLSCKDFQIPLTPVKSYNRFFKKAVGYVAVKGLQNAYVELLKTRLSAYLLVCFIALSLTVGGVFGYIRFFAGLDASGINSRPGLELDDQAVDWRGTLPAANDNNAQEGIRIPGYKQMIVEAGTTDISVNLVNPEGNPCYFVIKIVLTDTGEQIYESKLIEPGKGFYNISITRPLQRGEYKAQIHYEPYDLSTRARLNGAVINFDLLVR